MVERKVWRSNSRRFLAAATGVMIGPLSMLKEPKNPVYKPIILFEVRHVNSNIRSAFREWNRLAFENGTNLYLPL
jgi:hypothetical protein